MTHHVRECLQRAACCAELAEAENNPDFSFLLKLATSWTRAAQENVEATLENA